MGLIVQDKALQAAAELRGPMKVLRKRDRSLFDQVHRAMNSVVLNIAEADGNDPGTAKARFASACGSAKEVQHPGDGAYLIKAPVELGHSLGVDIPPRSRDVERRSRLLRRPTCRCEPKRRIPVLVSPPLGNVQHHALRRPSKLIRQLPIPPLHLCNQRRQLPHDLLGPDVNILSFHERLLGFGFAFTR